jgi:hypothetical protein
MNHETAVHLVDRVGSLLDDNDWTPSRSGRLHSNGPLQQLRDGGLLVCPVEGRL